MRVLPYTHRSLCTTNPGCPFLMPMPQGGVDRGHRPTMAPDGAASRSYLYSSAQPLRLSGCLGPCQGQARGMVSSPAPFTAFGAGWTLRDADGRGWGGGDLHARVLSLPLRGSGKQISQARGSPERWSWCLHLAGGGPRRREGGGGRPGSSGRGRAQPCTWETLCLPRCEAGALRIPSQGA